VQVLLVLLLVLLVLVLLVLVQVLLVLLLVLVLLVLLVLLLLLLRLRVALPPCLVAHLAIAPVKSAVLPRGGKVAPGVCALRHDIRTALLSFLT